MLRIKVSKHFPLPSDPVHGTEKRLWGVVTDVKWSLQQRIPLPSKASSHQHHQLTGGLKVIALPHEERGERAIHFDIKKKKRPQDIVPTGRGGVKLQNRMFDMFPLLFHLYLHRKSHSQTVNRDFFFPRRVGSQGTPIFL